MEVLFTVAKFLVNCLKPLKGSDLSFTSEHVGSSTDTCVSSLIGAIVVTVANCKYRA